MSTQEMQQPIEAEGKGEDLAAIYDSLDVPDGHLPYIATFEEAVREARQGYFYHTKHAADAFINGGDRTTKAFSVVQDLVGIQEAIVNKRVDEALASKAGSAGELLNKALEQRRQCISASDYIAHEFQATYPDHVMPARNTLEDLN